MRRYFAIFAAAVVAASLGVASAQWIADGSGTGRAVAGSAQGLSITPGVPTVPLYPGGNGDVALTITNSNPYDVEVVELAVTGPVIALDQACEAAGHQVTASGATGSWVIPAGSHFDVVLPGAASMGADAASECQGVEFEVPFSLG